HYFAKEEIFCEDRTWAVLRVTGEDAFGFLQGQFSQDLRGGVGKGPREGFWLTTKGKVAGHAVVAVRSEEDCLVVSWSQSAGELRERLEGFIIADDVVLEDETADWLAWRIAGEATVTWAIEWAGKRDTAETMAWRD